MSEPRTDKELRDHDIAMAEQQAWNGLEYLIYAGQGPLVHAILIEVQKKLAKKIREPQHE